MKITCGTKPNGAASNRNERIPQDASRKRLVISNRYSKRLRGGEINGHLEDARTRPPAERCCQPPVALLQKRRRLVHAVKSPRQIIPLARRKIPRLAGCVSVKQDAAVRAVESPRQIPSHPFAERCRDLPVALLQNRTRPSALLNLRDKSVRPPKNLATCRLRSCKTGRAVKSPR